MEHLTDSNISPARNVKIIVQTGDNTQTDTSDSEYLITLLPIADGLPVASKMYRCNTQEKSGSPAIKSVTATNAMLSENSFAPALITILERNLVTEQITLACGHYNPESEDTLIIGKPDVETQEQLLAQLDTDQWIIPTSERKVQTGRELDNIYLWAQNDKGKQKETKVGELDMENQTA